MQLLMKYKRLSTYLWTFGSRVLVIGLTAIFGVLSARVLGPVDKGTYTVSILIPSLISTVAMLAGPQLVVMDVSKYGRLVYRLHKLLNWSSAVAVAVGLAYFVMQVTSSSNAFSFITLLLSGTAFIGIALIVSEFLAALLQARKQFKALALLRVLQIFVPGLMMIVGAIYLGLEGATLGYVFGVLIVGITSWFLWDRAFEVQQTRRDRADKIPWGYVLTTNLTLVVLFLSYRADVLLLNAISNSMEVGIYSAAVALAELVLVASMSMSTVRAPIYARNPSRSLSSDTWQVFGLSLVGSAMIAILSPILIPLLFGVEYLESINATWALLPGITLLAVYRYISNAEIIRGHKFGVLYSCLVSIAVDVGVLCLIGGNMGATGASLAATLAYASGLAYLLIHRGVRVNLKSSNVSEPRAFAVRN